MGCLDAENEGGLVSLELIKVKGASAHAKFYE